MKKILIVEGIATSGKSSLIKELIDLLGENKIRVYSESETHIPIREDTEKLHIKFFRSLLKDAYESELGIIIFDRLHFTAAFRAKANINQYTEIEDLLLEHNTLVAYLKIEESAIKERVEFYSKNPRVALSTEHDGESWGEHIKTRGQSFNEIAAYYIGQQRSQLERLKYSKLKNLIFDATNNDYKAIASQITSDWLNK